MGLGGPSWSLPAFVDSLPLQLSLHLTREPQPLVRHSEQRLTSANKPRADPHLVPVRAAVAQNHSA